MFYYISIQQEKKRLCFAYIYIYIYIYMSWSQHKQNEREKEILKKKDIYIRGCLVETEAESTHDLGQAGDDRPVALWVVVEFEQGRGDYYYYVW